MPVHTRFVRVNGLQLHYREWGSSAAAVVFLHGGCAHAGWWEHTGHALADRYHSIAIDLRGHGDSQHPHPPAYHIDDYAADVTAFVDALGWSHFHLVGHSLGGMIATAVAAQVPQRLKSLVLVDTQVRISSASARYMMRLRHFPQPMYRDRAQALARFRLLPVQTNAAPELLRRIAAGGIRQQPDGRWTLKFDRESLAHAQPQDLSPVLRTLSCPLLIIRGAQSTVVPADRFAALLASLPAARGIEIPDAHHHVMLDNPPEFERVLRTFLDGVEHGQQCTFA